MCRFVCYSGDEMPVDPIVFGGTHTLVRQSYDAKEMGHGIHNARWIRRRLVPGGTSGANPGGPPHLARSGARGRAFVRALDLFARPREKREPGHPPGPRGSGAVRAPAMVLRTERIRAQVPTHTPCGPLRSTLPDELYTRIRGTSDTETLFLLAVAEVWRGASLATALARVGARAGSLDVRCKLNMILADGRDLAVIRTSQLRRDQLVVHGPPGIARSRRNG